MPAPYDQFILFGDSITQQSYDQTRGFGFAAALQNAYIRRLDVVNRGFSGYNTDHALKVLPSIIPSPEVARIRFLVVFFGANDSVVKGSPSKQHVPLDRYISNLETIITHPLVTVHKPRIILVAPPPINEHLLWAGDRENGHKSVSRLSATTKSYADAVVNLGEKLGVPVLNLWAAFMAKTGFDAASWSYGDALDGSLDVPQHNALVKLMHDGLHFNPVAYEIYFHKLIEIIKDHWPEQLPENLPVVFPPWNEPATWEAFEASRA